MKRWAKKFIFLLVLIVFPLYVAKAGCPIDVKDDYQLENLTCEGACENLSIHHGDSFYYKNDEQCTYCNTLTLRASTWEGKFKFEGYGSYLADYRNADIFLNGQKIPYDGKSFEDEPDFWKNKYEIHFGKHIFEAKLKKNADNRIDYELQCLEGCEGIKIKTYSRDDEEVFLYDSCNQPVQCTAINISHYAECGGGYGVNLSLSKNGEEIYEHPFLNTEDMKDRVPVTTQIGEVTLKYDLVKESSSWAINFENLKLIVLVLAISNFWI